MTGLILAQLGFGNWMMLGWGFAALIPIAIHLLRQRRQTVVPWAAMQLLLQVIHQQSRSSKLQQLILLLLRIAVLVLLAVALARPFFAGESRSDEVVTARSSKLWILVLDTSYSMGYQTEGSSRIEKAKRYLAEKVSNSQAGDAFALVTIDTPSRAVIGSPTFDSQNTLIQLQRLDETACGSDLIAALDLVDDVIRDSGSNPNMPQEIEVVIASDLGRDAWSLQPEDRSMVTLAKIAQRANIQLESFGEQQIKNCAVEACMPSTYRPLVGEEMSLDVTVACYGDAVQQLPVQLQLNGQVIASTKVDLDVNARRQIQFKLTMRTAGEGVLSVIIPDDNLMADNRFDVVVEASQGHNTLIVQSGSVSRNPWKLALLSQVASLSDLEESQLRTVSELSWDTLNWSDWDTLVLDDISLSPGQLDRLASFATAGGSVVICWGKQQSLNRLQALSSSLLSSVGFKFRGMSNEGDWSIDPLEYQSPVIAPFAGFPNSGLLTTPIFRYWQIETSDPTLITDIGLNSGEPFLVRKRLGSGWIASILSAPEDGQGTPTQSGWNAMTTWPSFLPLAQLLIKTLAESGPSITAASTGQPIADILPLFSDATQIKLLKPDQSSVTIAASRLQSNSQASWIYSDTFARGIYRIKEPVEAQRAFAVNINPEQSSLDSLTATAITARLPQRQSAAVENPRSNLNDSVNQDDRLARVALSLLLVVLLSESTLAWWLGRQSQ